MFNYIKKDNIEVKEKVIGRRNWVIYTWKNYATLYGWGIAKRHHILSATFKTIKENNLNWIAFTYKKDALEALQKLEQMGYKVEIAITD